VLFDSGLLRTSEQCKKLNVVDQTHPALVRAVLQRKLGLSTFQQKKIRWYFEAFDRGAG